MKIMKRLFNWLPYVMCLIAIIMFCAETYSKGEITDLTYSGVIILAVLVNGVSLGKDIQRAHMEKMMNFYKELCDIRGRQLDQMFEINNDLIKDNHELKEKYKELLQKDAVGHILAADVINILSGSRKENNEN